MLKDEEKTKLFAEICRSEPDYEPVDGISGLLKHSPKFVSDFQSIDRILIRFFLHKHNKKFLGKVLFGPQCEGPPCSVHGGAVAAVLDESMGQASWLAGHPCLGAKIEVNFKKRIPFNQVFMIHAAITLKEEKKFFVAAQIIAPDGIVMADSIGIFIYFSPEKLAHEIANARTAEGINNDKGTSK